MISKAMTFGALALLAVTAIAMFSLSGITSG
jgi:hypothetical protein